VLLARLLTLKRLQFLDVSGVGNSGKTAVCDLLREIDGIHVPPYWFEFDFIRIPNGLLDLRHRLLADWSPIRSHYGIKAFCRAAEQMGLDPAWWDFPGLLRSSSQRYNRDFDGKFVDLSKKFAQSFVKTSYYAEWPYDDMQLWAGWRLLRKILHKTGLRARLRRRVFVAEPTDFDARATAYLRALFSFRVPAACDIAILNNGFEPFNPIPGLNMIEGARQIVVIRDPRDVYVSGLNRHKVRDGDKSLLSFDNDGLNKSFLATDNLAEFVVRQRILYDRLYLNQDARILRVRFEDLCLSYGDTCASIFDFLGIDPARHISPKTLFIPKKSQSGIGLWRSYGGQNEIDFIRRALPDILFE
jgi:hypothetical protein